MLQFVLPINSSVSVSVRPCSGFAPTKSCIISVFSCNSLSLLLVSCVSSLSFNLSKYFNTLDFVRVWQFYPLVLPYVVLHSWHIITNICTFQLS
jgi:hypothetical protein